MRRKFSKMFWVIVLIAFFDISRGSDQQNQGTDGIDSAVIINGIEVADRSDHAYMASMICLNLGRCGATLIAADMILSAAHCITIRSSGTLEKAPSCTIYLGGLVYYDGDVVRTVNSNRMMHHEDYTGLSPFKNDLSLLRIDAVSVTSQVAPIPLPQSGANFQGATVKIVGWGITETGSTSLRLHVAETQIRTDEVCEANWNCPSKNPSYDRNHQVCYSGSNVNGICSGDSGGPVVAGSRGSPVLVAINSFVRPATSNPGCSTSSRSLLEISARVRTNSLSSWFQRMVSILQQWKETSTQTPLPAPCRIDTPSVGPEISTYLDWISSSENYLRSL